MTRHRSLSEIDDFLGSAHVFASAVADIIEQRLLEKAVEGQVTASQMKLLKLVAMTNSYTLGDVASFLRVSNAAASKAVDRLVRRGPLRRPQNPEELCLKCGIYFREHCLVRQLVPRNCFYQGAQKSRQPGQPEQ